MVIAVVDPNKWKLKETVRVVRLAYLSSEVVMFSDSELAVRYLKRHDVDMLFTEIPMPQLNGFELQARVESYQPKIVTVFVSNTEVEKTWNSRKIKYVNKPITFESLKDAMAGTRFEIK